jgi:hypothetical protein
VIDHERAEMGENLVKHDRLFAADFSPTDHLPSKEPNHVFLRRLRACDARDHLCMARVCAGT